MCSSGFEFVLCQNSPRGWAGSLLGSMQQQKLPDHPLLNLLRPSSPSDVQQASEPHSKGANSEVDDIENVLGRLSLTSCHHEEELGTASSREENDTGDSQTRHPSLSDYYGSTSAAADNEDDSISSEFDYVVEVYGFNPSLKTKDIITELLVYGAASMSLKWVDDTHALAIYTSSSDAKIASKAPYNKFKARLLEKSTNKASIAVAEKAAAQRKEDIINEKWFGKKPPQRPKTSSAVARRMVSHALGVRVPSQQRRKDVTPAIGKTE